MKTALFANDLGEIRVEDIGRFAPAATSSRPHPDVSDRYTFVDTMSVIDTLVGEGYKVRRAIGGLRGGSRDYGMHAVFLTKPFEGFSKDDLYPEIVLKNSHDRSCRASLSLGVYRVACGNGMIAGTASFTDSLVLTHVGDLREKIVEAARHLSESVPKLGEAINRWSNRIMSPDEQETFNSEAYSLRGGNGEPVSFGNVRRGADEGDDLWRVFNRAQECLMNGGFRVQGRKRVSKARPIKQVGRYMKINQQLWDLAESYIQN